MNEKTFTGEIYLLSLYRTMLKIRLFEESIGKIYNEGKTPKFNISKGPIPGELYLSTGQESSAAGVCAYLRKEDVVIGSHRSHHFAIAKGVDLKKIAAEILGKETGFSAGKGGSMHLFDPENNFNCNGIVGACFPQAVGVGIAANIENKNYIGVAVAGEGAANQGTFHESLNLASLWKLPVIFVIEDNNWAISTSKTSSTSVTDNSERARGYGIPGVSVDGDNVLAVYETAKEAVYRARQGEGPTLIEIKVYRLGGHFAGDEQKYRPNEDIEFAINKDPIPRLKKKILDGDFADETALEKINKEIQQEVDEAIKFALESPYPDPKEALRKVFSSSGGC